VVAFIELKARFDEANNIKWSKVMKEAGVKIIYSIPEIKVHSKIALIRKRKGGDRQSFAILSTGNFNEITAQFYTDHVLMTTDEAITSELLQLFKFLELRNEVDNSKKLKFNALLVSQFNMISELEKLVNKEIAKAKKGLPAMIRIKVNNLEEPEFIDRLYEAEKAGVKIHLLVRGICCIVPGVPGGSNNIFVKRIVDRYLEHSRILIFGTDENPQVIIGSADLMTRNLRHRIEVYVKIKKENCKKELIHYFELQWKDNDKSVWLLPGYQQELSAKNNGTIYNAQQSIYNFLSTTI
jgi:polyphosphate kinase